jgi:hypothetical protein
MVQPISDMIRVIAALKSPLVGLKRSKTANLTGLYK